MIINTAQVLYQYTLDTDSHVHFLTQSCTQLHDTPLSQLILITSGNVVIGANCQLDLRSHLADGFGYTAASQTPHSQQTSTPASVFEVQHVSQARCTRREESVSGRGRGVLVWFNLDINYNVAKSYMWCWKSQQEKHNILSCLGS